MVFIPIDVISDMVVVWDIGDWLIWLDMVWFVIEAYEGCGELLGLVIC